ncbi:hypothetical protein KP509_16G014000 [Ceratopteris richardii]|uniref:BHLH domain-containing protein n=1 Tax=Ceratopteris richardii TaxID=49495 RepID=A0A8T2T2G1_CERRI|nr:hypothetical protein KP509_16G014000 [Ceratopteris richardii]
MIMHYRQWYPINEEHPKMSDFYNGETVLKPYSDNEIYESNVISATSRVLASCGQEVGRTHDPVKFQGRSTCAEMMHVYERSGPLYDQAFPGNKCSYGCVAGSHVADDIQSQRDLPGSSYASLSFANDLHPFSLITDRERENKEVHAGLEELVPFVPLSLIDGTNFADGHFVSALFSNNIDDTQHGHVEENAPWIADTGSTFQDDDELSSPLMSMMSGRNSSLAGLCYHHESIGESAENANRCSAEESSGWDILSEGNDDNVLTKTEVAVLCSRKARGNRKRRPSNRDGHNLTKPKKLAVVHSGNISTAFPWTVAAEKIMDMHEPGSPETAGIHQIVTTTSRDSLFTAAANPRTKATLASLERTDGDYTNTNTKSNLADNVASSEDPAILYLSASPQVNECEAVRPIQPFEDQKTMPHGQQSTRSVQKQSSSRVKKCTARNSQSVAARHRRERISQRIRILQQLIPNGTKVDIVTMLEKAINYVKFLQLQVKVRCLDYSSLHELTIEY